MSLFALYLSDRTYRDRDNGGDPNDGRVRHGAHVDPPYIPDVAEHTPDMVEHIPVLALHNEVADAHTRVEVEHKPVGDRHIPGPVAHMSRARL
jgi:hypothetical protein